MLKNKYYLILGVLVLAVVVALVLTTIIKKSTTQLALEKVKKEDLKEPVQTPVQTQAQLIMQHFKKGDNELTIRLAKEYLTSNPNDITIINALAEAYINEGDLSAAETTVRKAIAIQPNDAWSCKLLVRIYREKARFEKDPTAKSNNLTLALEQVKKCLANSPNDTEFLTEAAQVYSEKGDKVNANQSIDKAIRIKPNDSYLIRIKEAINK